MWTLLEPLNLLRYRLVLRINQPLVRLPRLPAAEFSYVLGQTIASHLSGHEVAPWRKALAAWEGYQGLSFHPSSKKKQHPAFPAGVRWPVESVLCFRPPSNKNFWGMGETLWWEFKLLGDSADHEWFLEVFLPALEEAGYERTAPWCNATSLWGHFEVQAIYVAHGQHWEPVAREGRLDLRYRPDLKQWAEGLAFEGHPSRPLRRLTWLTPFAPAAGRSASAVSLDAILEALLQRLCDILPGRKRLTPDDLWQQLDEEEQFSLTYALHQAAQSRIQRRELQSVPRSRPGRWIGEVYYDEIPASTLPYLHLAAILHVGQMTHLGCGTFQVV